MAPRLSPGCAALRWWPSARSEAGRGFSLPRVHLTNPRHSRFNVRVRDTTHSLLVLKPRPSVAPGRGFLFDSRRGFDLNRRMRSFTASHIRERRRAPVSSAHTDRGFSLGFVLLWRVVKPIDLMSRVDWAANHVCLVIVAHRPLPIASSYQARLPPG
jgi:hypothetical protein